MNSEFQTDGNEKAENKRKRRQEYELNLDRSVFTRKRQFLHFARRSWDRTSLRRLPAVKTTVGVNALVAVFVCDDREGWFENLTSGKYGVAFVC